MSCADLGGRLVTRQELQRLQGILDSFPTTVAQDAAVLQGELVQQPARAGMCFVTVVAVLLGEVWHLRSYSSPHDVSL